MTASAAIVLAQGKNLPDNVTQPLEQILSWFLGGVLLISLFWLMISAGRFYMYKNGGDDRIQEASGAIVLNLIGAAISSSCSAVAWAIMSN